MSRCRGSITSNGRQQQPLSITPPFIFDWELNICGFRFFGPARGASLSPAEYRRAIATATRLYKLIDSLAPDYRKFGEFQQIVAALDSRPHPPTVIWDIDRLKRIHGECSKRFLHFQGISDGDYLSDTWAIRQLAFLDESAMWIWNTMKSRRLVVYRPEGLIPEAQSIWESFRTGHIDAESVRYRLQIVRPIVRLG